MESESLFPIESQAAINFPVSLTEKYRPGKGFNQARKDRPRGNANEHSDRT